LLAVLKTFGATGLFGKTYGPGTPRVLALHGWRRDHRDFDNVLRQPVELAALGIDLPGFGATPPPPAAWGSPQYAEALVPLVTTEMAPPVVVVGHSFGGRVAVHLAAARPDLVSGLVLTGVPLFRPGGTRHAPPVGFRTVRALRRAGLVSEARLEAARQRYGSADYKAASGVMREVLVRLLVERYDEQLAALRCRVELVWGDDDAESPLPAATQAVEILGERSHLVVCPGAGHFTPFSAPGELRAAIERIGATT
jgi:pimeloyl-ACP methyl ester carboxylesterase